MNGTNNGLERQAINNTLEPPPTTSLPRSLRDQLDRVQLLLNQGEYAAATGRPELAYAKAQQAMSAINTLIARSPEGGTLALLADMGCQGYEFQTFEQVDHHVIVERRIFGLSFGQAVVPTRTITRRESRGRVF